MSDLAGDVEREKETMKKNKQSDILELVKARQEIGFSQTVMAKRAGVSVNTVVTFEHGRRVSARMAKTLRDTYTRIKIVPDFQAFDGSGNMDAAWLRKQTETFLRNNCLGIVEKEKLAHFVLSTERLYEYGRILLLAAGKNID
jgi:DNA-binding XRE family transcriptional regulator